MPQYLETLKQLGLKDLATQRGKGRVSSLSSISKQFFKTHYDGYHPRMSRHLASTLKRRYISTRPKHERKTSEFVGEVRRKLLCLHEYNVQIAKVKFKYPRTEQLDALLIQYIELECGLLYDPYKDEVDETVEDEVRQRILRLLKVILHDALHNSEVPLKTTVKACDKALLKLFASVRVDCMTENNLIAKVILKLLDKLNLLDEVNQLKGKNIPFHQDTVLKDQLVCRVRQNLTTSDYESSFDDSDEEEVEVASIVHDDRFNYSYKPLEQPVFNEYIGKRNEKIKYAHLIHEPFEKQLSSFPCLSRANQVTRLNDDFPTKIKGKDNCDDVFPPDGNITNSKNAAHEVESQNVTVCSDVIDSVFTSDCSSSFNQKTVKLVNFENTMTVSNIEKNPKYPKEDMSCSNTFEKQINCKPEPVSQYQELNLIADKTIDPQNEVQDSSSGNMKEVHKKTVHQFEETGSVYENNKESDLLCPETNNSEEVQSTDPQSNGKINESYQSETHVSNAENFENFFERNSDQIQEIQNKNNLISKNTNVNDVIIRHENNFNEATNQPPDSLNNNEGTYNEVQDDNNTQDNIIAYRSDTILANDAMDQSNLMTEVPIFDTAQPECRKLDETTTSTPTTIDLDSLPDTNGLKSTKTSVSERITNGLVTIEILDDDDDEEADYTCISFNERQSQLKDNMADNLIQTNKIKVEDSEENHSSNFPIAHTEKENQYFMDSNSNKTSRSSNSTNQNQFKENSNNDSVGDVEIIISDSEDDFVEIESNKSNEEADDELREYLKPKDSVCISHLENDESVCEEISDTTINNSVTPAEDTQTIIRQDEVSHIEEESLNQDENVNKIPYPAVTDEESTEMLIDGGVTCEESNVETDTTKHMIEEPSENNIEQQREVTNIHDESTDVRLGVNSDVPEVPSDIQEFEITTEPCNDMSHLNPEHSNKIQDFEDTCTINDQTDDMIIAVTIDPQNNSEGGNSDLFIEHDDKVTSTESLDFDKIVVPSPQKCDQNKEELINVQETEQDVYENKNMNLSSDMSSTEEHAEECEETFQPVSEAESVVVTEKFEDINNEEKDEQVLSLKEHENQKTLKVSVESDVSNNVEVQMQNNINTGRENVNICDQEEKVTDTDTGLEASSYNVVDEKMHETLTLGEPEEHENDERDEQQEALVSEAVEEVQPEVAFEPHIQSAIENHSEQTLIENSDIRSDITAENVSHDESINEKCINEQIITQVSEVTSTAISTSNFIDTSELTDPQQNDYSSQNFTDQNIIDTGNDHPKETAVSESAYEVIDYSQTTPYTASISNDAYNNVYSNCENGLYNTQQHSMEIYSMGNMHQTVSIENEAKVVQNIVHTQIVQDASIPQKVQLQEGETTTINESFYYKSNISSTLNEVEYVEYDTEKKVNLELLANIAVNQETLEVKTELPSSDTSQETPKRRKSKVRLDYKKKPFSRETLPRAVKQFPKKNPKQKPNEEIENNRITRTRINKIKAKVIATSEVSKPLRIQGRMDSKYKPHDFISVENPTIPPPTNNVYAQKRFMETNTTSEDSNDSCESTLFIDLGDKTIEKSIKSVFEEETIDDMLEFVLTEEKPAVCISIPDNEDNCISDSDSFQILKQIEDFVDNSKQSSVSPLTKESSEPLDQVTSVESKTEEPLLTTADIVPQVVEDTLSNSPDKDMVTAEDVEGNSESKTIKTTNHSIEHILNKTTVMNEINVGPVNYSKESTTENTNKDQCDVTSSQTQPAEISKEILSDFNRTEDIQKTAINLCNGTILQTTFENHIENFNTDMQSEKASFKDGTSAEATKEIKETAEDNEQIQPENLSMNKSKFSSSRPEENSEKIFKTKAAMKAYEDKLQPELPMNSDKTESAEVTSESSLESPLRVDTGDSSIDKNDLNTSPISTTSFSSEIEISSEFNQSEEMSTISCEQNLNMSADSINSKDDSAINLTKESSVEIPEVKDTAENLPQTPQETETRAKCKDDDKTPTILTTESSQEESNLNNAKQELEKSQVSVVQTLSATETSVIIDENVLITEVECFKSETSENRDESLHISEENKTKVNDKSIEDSSKHESLNVSPTKSTHSTPEKGKSSKVSDEEKGRMLENTIKKMKEKIVESERAKKEQKSENKSEEKKSNTQKDESHSIRDKSSSDRKHHRTSSKSNSDDVKDKTSEVQKKDNSHRKRHSRSPSKSRTSDKKQDTLNSDKEKSHHKDSPNRSSSKSKSTDKRSKHSDGENEGKRRSKSISVDEKEKQIETTSDQENVDRKRRSRSSSKSKTSDSKSKQISTDRASSKHKSSETKDKHNNSTDDCKDTHKKGRSSKSPSKSKSSDKNDKKIDVDKTKARDKSDTCKSKLSSTKTETKYKKDDTDLQQMKDKTVSDKDKRHEGHKSSKSKDSFKTEVQSSQEKQDEPQRKDEHIKNDKSRRSHSKEKTKIENSSRTEKREKSVSSTKDKHKENNKKSKHNSNESKETEVSMKNKKVSDKKSNNLCKENKENASYPKKDKHSEKKLSDHHGEQKDQKENTLASAKKNFLDNSENASSDIDRTKPTNKQNYVNKNEEGTKSTQTDIPKKRKHEVLEENDKNSNNDGLSNPKIPKSDIIAGDKIEQPILTESGCHEIEKEKSGSELNNQKIPVHSNESDKNSNNDGLSKPKIPKSDIVAGDKIEQPILTESGSHEIEKEKSGSELNNQKVPVHSNEFSEICTSVAVNTNEEGISTKQNDKSVTENLTGENTQNILKDSHSETIQENPPLIKDNPLIQISEPEIKAMEVDTISQPTEEDKISNDITNNNEISHITGEQDIKLKLAGVGPPEAKEPEPVPEVLPAKVIVQDAILPAITSSESVYVPNTFSTSVTIDMQVLTSTADSTVKHFHVETTALPIIPNVSVATISTSSITSKEIPIPITIQSTPSCSTSGIQEKPVLFTFNTDGEIDARENLNSTDLFDAPLGLEDISPTKLPIGTNPSLDLISPSTSISEISNSMNLVQTLGTSTINFINDPEIDIQQASKQNSFAPNFTRGTRVTEIRCFVEKESTADHNYTLGDPLLGGNNEDKNILTTGLSLSNSPEEFPLNESHLEELTFNENNFMEENGMDDLGLLLPCKKEKPDFDNIIDESIPKPEDIENSLKQLNMLVHNSQTGQPKTISVDNTTDHTTPSDCSYNLGIDYAVNKLLFLRGSEVTSQNNSFPTIPDIENINIMESNVSSSHRSKETTEDSINMRNHDETANINAICTSYANFMPPPINQKVVVEPVEHCIITSLDQLEKDYNINETCDRVEKNQPNPVTNSETNPIKTSTPYKSSKFATFLQTVKRMDAQRNEAPKVKDEMENYTVRRHNRTPVFPPKKKTATQQQHTKSPPESKKNEILSFDTVVPVSTPQTTETNECRIRVKTNLMKPPEPKNQVVDSLSSLDYINEHDQNVASEVVLPFSKPSPSEKISADLKEKNADTGLKIDDEISKASKHARFDKEGNDYIMENILNSHNDAKTRINHAPEVTKAGEKQQDNVTEVNNKKRKSTLSDNSDTSDSEKYSKRSDKRQKKSDDEFAKIRTSTTDHGKQHNKKSHETVVTPANNDEIFDKLVAEGPVNKVFTQRMTEQQQKPQQKNENGPSNASSDVSKNRGYSTAPDGYKKAKVVPSPPVPAQLHEASKHRENVRHPHPDMDKRRDQRKPGYHQGTYNPPPDRRYVDKRHGAALPVIESSPKRFIRNSTNPYSSKSDPCTSRGQPYKSRDRRSSTEHLNSLLPNKKDGTVMKDDDKFSWITKFSDAGVLDTPSDLFNMPPGPKREDPRK